MTKNPTPQPAERGESTAQDAARDSHLHALEERAVRIRERIIDVQKNDAQWKAQAVQLFQTEKEIADEREFLGLEDMSTDDLYAALEEK